MCFEKGVDEMRKCLHSTLNVWKVTPALKTQVLEKVQHPKKVSGFMKGQNILSTLRVMNSFEPDCKHNKMVLWASKNL